MSCFLIHGNCSLRGIGGVSQLPPHSRFAYSFGPFLLATVGAWDSALDCAVVNASRVPGFDATRPAAWLASPPGTPDGALPPASASFAVRGVDGVAMRPYYAVQEEQFTVYPVVVSASGAS